MPKLKLSGRKLCTTGRKLAVCGCGSPCCAAGNACEIKKLYEGRFRTWWNIQASGTTIRTYSTPPTYRDSCTGVTYVGSHVGQKDFAINNVPPTTNPGFVDYSEAACYIQQITAVQTLNQQIGTISGAGLIPSTPGLPGSGTEMQISVTQPTPPGSTFPTWQIQKADAGTGLEVTWNAYVGVRVTGSGFTDSDFNNVFVRLFVNAAGAISVLGFSISGTAIPSTITSGSITPRLIKEGNCVLGIGASFTATRNVAPTVDCPLVSRTISGDLAIAYCGIARGCTNPDSVCGATSVPGAPATLVSNVDDALFT